MSTTSTNSGRSRESIGVTSSDTTATSWPTSAARAARLKMLQRRPRLKAPATPGAKAFRQVRLIRQPRAWLNPSRPRTSTDGQGTTMTRNRLFVRYVSLAAFCAAGAFGAQAARAEAKFQKKEIEVTSGQQTDLTKPKEPVKEKKEQTGPTLTVDAFVGQQRDKINKITDKQIKYMLDLIRNSSEDDSQKPDYYFRLGELLAEKQRNYTMDARAQDQKIFEAQQAKNSGLVASLQQKQKKAEKDAENTALQAVKSYVSASKYPKYNRICLL